MFIFLNIRDNGIVCDNFDNCKIFAQGIVTLLCPWGASVDFSASMLKLQSLPFDIDGHYIVLPAGLALAHLLEKRYRNCLDIRKSYAHPVKCCCLGSGGLDWNKKQNC